MLIVVITIPRFKSRTGILIDHKSHASKQHGNLVYFFWFKVLYKT